MKNTSLVIPNEIVNQIFIELSVKTLSKFKCVCKEWNYIIEDPEFVNYHRIKSYTRSKGFGIGFLKFFFDYRTIIIHGSYSTYVVNLEEEDLQEEFGSIYIVDLEEEDSKPRISMPISLSTGRTMDYHYLHSRVIEGLVNFGDFVVNPSTKEVIKLPDHKWKIYKESYIYPGFHYVGFDAYSKTYKALALQAIPNDSILDDKALMLLGQVLTLGTTDLDSNSWRNVIIPTYLIRNFSHIQIWAYLPVDNKIFFLVRYQYDNTNNEWGLLVFEVGEERFIGVLEGLPWDFYAHVNLFEMNGKLVIMTDDESLHEQRIFWILEDFDFNGNKNKNQNVNWTKRNILLPLELTYIKCHPICTFPTNPTEILFKICEDYFELEYNMNTDGISHFYYDLETNNIRIIKDTDKCNKWYFKHVETMFQLKPQREPHTIGDDQ